MFGNPVSWPKSPTRRKRPTEPCPSGQTDLLATEKELPGSPEYLNVYSNVEFMAVCHIKSDQRPDLTNDESMNLGSFTSRVMVINTLTGTRILGDTPEFERWVAEKDAK